MKQLPLFLMTCVISGSSLASELLAVAEKTVKDSGLTVLNKLNPQYIQKDLDGDGKNEIALFVEDQTSKKKGICIVESGSDSCVILGAGKKFYAGGDDFRWVDTWQLIPAGETWETTFEPNGDVLGERKVILENDSLKICVDEGGCGVITYKNGQYIWVHQAD